MKSFLVACFLWVVVFIPAAAQACHYDAQKAEKNIVAAVFIGKVKIIKVEKRGEEEFYRRTVTYEVVKAEKRAPGFDKNIITIEGGPLSSCDHPGPWNVGMVVDEIFFMENGRLNPASLNMKIHNSNGEVKEE